jgi:poly(3-hydroxybutyrate) depolymerase
VPDVETTEDGRATRHTYGGGQDGSEVTLWTTQGGGHEWPGWPLGATRPGGALAPVSASSLIWQFFVAHARTA